MSTDRDHLLAAVAANPDDDLPRLVFADWLDDHGGGEADAARAAFIRAQIADWRDPEPWELSATPRPSAAIEATHREAWLAALPAKQRGWVRFERGFAESLWLTKVRTGFLPLLEKPAEELLTVRRIELP